MTGFHFAEPQWVHMLWAVFLCIAGLFLLERRAGLSLSHFMAHPLQARLVQRTSDTRRTVRLLFLTLTGLFLTLALMRPQWGVQFLATPRAGAEIMVCLDVSKSMLAEDVSPNRLERAKAELRDLLTYLKGDQIGLIAFAGRASVLSPLTPDFGFLRLALDQANATSVSRGGTRLEEPIRKAIAGFGSTSDVSRSILLITDGEDQDSFPLEAAKDAAQRGIRILAIGFGDEAGSEITLTDAKTGVRAPLRDRNGTVVKSRLDGGMLRELALLTEGAYIPAGTGVLDLESIYERHIAGLTRGKLDGQGRRVHNDAFQWAILLGLLSLLATVASTTSGVIRGGGPLGRLLLVVGLLLTVSTQAMARASALQPPTSAGNQGTPPAGNQGAVSTGNQSAPPLPPGEQAEPPPTKTPSPPQEAPRTVFNQGLAQFQQDALEEAAQSFESARARAAIDGELRFRATYNLGWVDVKQADALLEQDPQKALQALHRAASWFREAIALRPAHEDTRYNLEVILKRALVLADRLANTDPKDWKARLDQTIQAQRTFLEALRTSLTLADAQQDAHATARLRPVFRALSAQQLEVLAEGEAISQQAGDALETLRKKSDETRTPEEAVQAHQLDRLLHYLHRARERMGQARSRMRHLLAEQAFRRAAAALTALKRARAQLLDPKTRLDALLADGITLARFSGAKAALERGISAPEQTKAPPWLTLEYLQESQKSLQERTQELHQGIVAGLAQSAQPPPGETPEPSPPAPEQETLVRALKKAEPLIGQAATAFATAQTALEANTVAEAIPPQSAALAGLAEAREYFLDLRGLIERARQDENRIASFLHPKAQTGDPSGRPDAIELYPSALELQEINLARAQRLQEQIVMARDKAREAVQTIPPDPAQASGQGPAKTPPSEEASPDQEQLKNTLKRMEQADELQTRLLRQMKTARLDLERLVDQPPVSSAESEAVLVQAQGRVLEVQNTLERLRQLFFSVVEHLQETLRRQTALNDATQEAAALAESRGPEETAQAVGPLVPRQEGLMHTTERIGEALRTQADLLSQQAPPPEQAQTAQNTHPSPERFRTASDTLTTAQARMQEAATHLAHAPPAFPEATDRQTQAVTALREALVLLSPPDTSHGKTQKPSEAPQQKQAPQPDPSAQQGTPDADPSQLLQGVRDREAQRRSEKGRARSGAYEPVEKDW